jgi:asparaginyl-tRNA synthetase
MFEQLTQIREILKNGKSGEQVTFGGWVRTRRDSKGGFSFLHLNDGSCQGELQIIAEATLANYENEIRHLTTGCSVLVEGEVRESPGKEQSVEVLASSLTVLGLAPAEEYPLQKKRQSFEFLRELTHLRARTNTFGAIARLRNQLAMAVHQFFQERGFIYLHTPIITTSDCEGAGEVFTVTTQEPDKVKKTPAGEWDYSGDFFGHHAGLTVSGQLEGEAYALAMSRIYTFGPTFRAENSHTSRHLAEFWMIEPEMAFCDLQGDVNLAVEFVQAMIRHALQHCPDEMEFFNKWIQKGVRDNLEKVASAEFEQMTYTEAVAHLEKSGKKFEYPVSWGANLQSEHERWLTEEHVGRPVVVTDYPTEIKAFYMRLSDDEKTVAAMDVLVPGVGEIIGGSQREDRLDVLQRRMVESGLEPEEYRWYLDLRRFGSVPHAGFGLGFERLIQYVSGMSNIRDVIPFPRTPGHGGL